MFRIFFGLLTFLISFTSFAQYSIKGTLNTSNNYTWVLLYNIQNGKQNYIDSADVVDGKFEFTLQENANPGIYKVFYQIENELFVEFIFNYEDIEFNFDPSNPNETILFLNSDENKIYQQYFKAITTSQNGIDSIQVVYFNSTDSKQDKKLIKNYHKKRDLIIEIQNEYKKKSNGKLVSHFIRASRQYNANDPIKKPDNYLTEIKKHFFEYIDFNDAILSNSTYINDKITNFIFYLNQNNDIVLLNQMQQESINIVMAKLNSNDVFKKNIIEDILKQYAKEQNAEMVNLVMDDHYNKIPKSLQDHELKFTVLSSIKTAVGKNSPDISWTENGISKNLYGIFGPEIYIIVFFSSGCPHCQKEMPLFYDLLKDNSKVKVIAIGLEDEKEPWEIMIKDLSGFTHILDLKKWKSSRVNDFGISSIPSYFILDKNKKIIAKPESVEEIIAMFDSK